MGVNPSQAKTSCLMTVTKTSYTNKRHPLFDASRLMDREIYDSQKLSGTYPKAPLTGYRLTAPRHLQGECDW